MAALIGDDELVQMVELHLSCEHLPKMDTLSHTDAYIQVWERFETTGGGAAAASFRSRGEWVEIGTTEVIWDTENPKFSTSIELAYHFEEQQSLRFTVMDKDVASADDLIGEAKVRFYLFISSYEYSYE